MRPEDNNIGNSTIQGAGAGASVGSAIAPGIGTAVGAVGGALIGGIGAAIKAKKDREAKLEETQRVERREDTAISRATIDSLRAGIDPRVNGSAPPQAGSASVAPQQFPNFGESLTSGLASGSDVINRSYTAQQQQDNLRLDYYKYADELVQHDYQLEYDNYHKQQDNLREIVTSSAVHYKNGKRVDTSRMGEFGEQLKGLDKFLRTNEFSKTEITQLGFSVDWSKGLQVVQDVFGKNRHHDPNKRFQELIPKQPHPYKKRPIPKDEELPTVLPKDVIEAKIRADERLEAKFLKLYGDYNKWSSDVYDKYLHDMEALNVEYDVEGKSAKTQPDVIDIATKRWKQEQEFKQKAWDREHNNGMNEKQWNIAYSPHDSIVEEVFGDVTEHGTSNRDSRRSKHSLGVDIKEKGEGTRKLSEQEVSELENQITNRFSSTWLQNLTNENEGIDEDSLNRFKWQYLKSLHSLDGSESRILSIRNNRSSHIDRHLKSMHYDSNTFNPFVTSQTRLNPYIPIGVDGYVDDSEAGNWQTLQPFEPSDEGDIYRSMYSRDNNHFNIDSVITSDWFKRLRPSLSGEQIHALLLVTNFNELGEWIADNIRNMVK